MKYFVVFYPLGNLPAFVMTTKGIYCECSSVEDARNIVKHLNS